MSEDDVKRAQKGNKESLSKIISEIQIPDNLNEIINENINNTTSKSSIKPKLILKKIVQVLISLLTIATTSGCVYAAVTGNSILDFLGFRKASQTFDASSININQTIQSDYVNVSLNRIASDNTFLILEYDINFTELGLKNIDSIKKSEEIPGNKIQIDSMIADYANDTLKLAGDIYVNGAKTEEYVTYTNKISNSEYKLYNIILMKNKKNKNNNLKIQVGAYYLQYNNISLYFDDVFCFFLDLSLEENQTNCISQNYTYQNISIDINSMVDSNIATVGKGNIKITNLTDELEDWTNITFKAFDNNNNRLNVETYVLKNMVTTENDEVIDLKIGNDDIEYENGTANIELLLLFKDGVQGNSEIKLIPMQDNIKIGDGINVNVYNQEENKIKINSTKIDTNYSKIAQEYSTQIYEDKDLINPYYVENATKISLTDFEINGLKLDMNIEEAMTELQRNYNKQNLDIICNLYLSAIENNSYCYYNDGYMELRFYKDINENIVLKDINVYDITIWEKYGMKEKDFISSYYSEQYYTLLNQSIYGYKVLYGAENVKDAFEGETIYGDYAYIFVNDSRDSFICYYNNNIRLNISIDPTTKEFTQLQLSSPELNN